MSSTNPTDPPAAPSGAPTQVAPYAPGDVIADRVSVNRATYPVRSCLSLPDGVSQVLGARWQVTFKMPGENLGYVWVDDDGYQPAGTFGPAIADEPVIGADRKVLADLLARHTAPPKRPPLTEPVPDYIVDRVLEALADASHEIEDQAERLIESLRYAVLHRSITQNLSDGEAIACTENTYEEWDARVSDATRALRELIRERAAWPVMEHRDRARTAPAVVLHEVGFSGRADA